MEPTPENIPSIAPLPGEVCAQYTRCGKWGCRCREGERHGPYYYRIWREGQQVRKVYVRREDLQSVQAACAAYKTYQRDLTDLKSRRHQLTLSIQREWRRTKRLLRAEAFLAYTPLIFWRLLPVKDS